MLVQRCHEFDFQKFSLSFIISSFSLSLSPSILLKLKKKKKNVFDKPAQTQRLLNGRHVGRRQPNKIAVVIHPISLILPLEKTNPYFGLGWSVCLKTSRFFISFPIPKHTLHFDNLRFTPVSITYHPLLYPQHGIYSYFSCWSLWCNVQSLFYIGNIK